MNPIFSRTLKALSTLAAVALLSACGASSTIDPFKPTRVIGLGDAYSDVGLATGAPFTVRGTGTVSTVFEQVATLFGVGSVGTPVADATYAALPSTGVFSYAMGNALISTNAAITTDASLAEQVDRLLADVGTFNSSKDLIIITAGTRDVRAGLDKTTTVDALMVQLKRLLVANARHILVMQPIERSGGTYATQALAFADEESLQIYKYLKTANYQGNPIILTSGYNPGLATNFNIATSPLTTTYGEFSTSSQVAYCPSPTTLTGCTVADGDGTTYATRLFADNLNLTPVGNRWVALQLFGATAQGWR
jgi:hypothetical protein